MAVDVQELAEEHWMYILSLLERFCTEDMLDYKEQFRFMYISAFIHGYKHGREEK